MVKRRPEEKNEKVKKEIRPNNGNAAVTILTSGCQFIGKMYCRGSSRIGGTIDGQLISEGLLIIEEEALIVAEIQAEDAIIQGRVKGKLKSKKRVELCSSSRFEGDIMTPILVINEGAQFNGRSTMIAVEKEEKTPHLREVKGDRTPEIDIGKSDNDEHIPDVAMLSAVGEDKK